MIADSTRGSRSEDPLNLTVRTGKPMISASAALAMGLNLEPKTGKDTQNTKGNQ